MGKKPAADAFSPLNYSIYSMRSPKSPREGFEIMKSSILISLFSLWGMLFSTAAMAFEPFPSIVDHTVFKQLPRESQREYIRAMMLALVDFEEGHRQIQKLPNTPANQKLKKTSWMQLEKLRQGMSMFMGAVGIPEAHARVALPNSQYCHDIAGNTNNVENKGECVIGGWYSTYIHNRSTGAKYCQRPACSVSPDVRAHFVQAQSSCGTGARARSMMACNPAIYGTQQPNGAGGSICINVDQVDTQNASLACLIEFEKRPNMDARLDSLIDRLTTTPNPESINLFNQVARMIFNICACGPGFEDQTRLNPDYVNYMQSHRTCYSLLGMMKLYADRIKSRNLGCNQLVINSSNVDTLVTDLSVLENYTNRVSVLGNLPTGTALSHTNYSSILQNYRSRFVTDAATAAANPTRITRNRVVANNDMALDHVANFDSQLNNTPSNVKAWCPLEPMPELDTTSGTPLTTQVPSTTTDDTNVDVTGEDEPIVVTGTRPDPLVIVGGDIPIVTPDLTNIPVPQLNVEEDTPTATCTFNFTITRATPDATTATVTGNVTTDPADHAFPEGETIKWSLDGQVIEGQTEKNLSYTIEGIDANTNLDEKELKVEVPGCSPCSRATPETPAEEPTPETDEEVGSCDVTATPTTATKFKLKVAVPSDYTVNSVEWSDTVTPPADAEENATEIELDRAAKETTYSVTIKIQEGDGPELTQSCEVKYPVGPVAPVQSGGGFAPLPQMPSLQLPSFFIRGVN